MLLPQEPVTLNVDHVGELNKKLADLRHDTNNNLSLIIAAAELLRRQPQRMDLWDGLIEKPHRIAETLAQFSRDLETALRIRRG